MGAKALLSLVKLRIRIQNDGKQTMSEKAHGQEGKSPDQELRSQNLAECVRNNTNDDN